MKKKSSAIFLAVSVIGVTVPVLPAHAALIPVTMYSGDTLGTQLAPVNVLDYSITFAGSYIPPATMDFSFWLTNIGNEAVVEITAPSFTDLVTVALDATGAFLAVANTLGVIPAGTMASYQMSSFYSPFWKIVIGADSNYVGPGFGIDSFISMNNTSVVAPPNPNPNPNPNPVPEPVSLFLVGLGLLGLGGVRRWGKSSA